MPHPPRASRAYRNVARVVRPFLRSVARRDWRGAEHFPTSGGYLVVVNHVTNLDPLTFAHFMYDHDVAPRFLAKDSLFRVPVLGPVLLATGQIPVARGTAAAGHSLTPAATALGAGEVVAVFPEGTLTRDPDLWPMVGKTGAARLALTTGVPVIPVAQWGAHRILGRYSKVFKPIPRKLVTVVAGPPIDLSDLMPVPGTSPDAAALRAATTRIMGTITAMLEEIRGERAPAPFDPRAGEGTR